MYGSLTNRAFSRMVLVGFRQYRNYGTLYSTYAIRRQFMYCYAITIALYFRSSLYAIRIIRSRYSIRFRLRSRFWSYVDVSFFVVVCHNETGEHDKTRTNGNVRARADVSFHNYAANPIHNCTGRVGSEGGAGYATLALVRDVRPVSSNARAR